MKTGFIILTLCIVQTAAAQPPWRARLYVHFKDSNNTILSDTVYFGLDSLGGDRLQVGLDVIDTNVLQNKVYSSDALIKQQFNTDCANLKTNILSLIPLIKQFQVRFLLKVSIGHNRQQI